MGKEDGPGHSCRLEGARALLLERRRIACVQPAPNVSRLAQRPHPVPENQRHPSREEKGGSLIINSAGGKVRPPARSRAPSRVIMPARLSSPRARAHGKFIVVSRPFFSLLRLYARGRVLRGQSTLPQLLCLLQSF